MARTFVLHRSAGAAAGVLAVVLLLAGCGGSEDAPPETVAAASEPADPTDPGELGDTEAEYTLPPPRPRGRLGDRLTLYGSNLGVKLDLTVTGVADPATVRSKPAAGGKRYVAVEMRMRNTGITVFESELEDAVLTSEAGTRARAVLGVKASCSGGFQRLLRLDVSRRREGCIVFKLPEGEQPKTLRLALEQEPLDEGVTWRLR